MTKKVAVILAGCGVYDGAEIYESTLTLLALDHAGAIYQCMAPNIPQHHVVNHLTGEEMAEKRNVLVEAARIARGNIIDLAKANPAEYDALIIPGGFGAAKNLSSFPGTCATGCLSCIMVRNASAWVISCSLNTLYPAARC